MSTHPPVLAALRRWPDLEADNLFAVDATDRLLLDEAADALAAVRPGEIAVVDDHYGALTLGSAERFGASGLRVHQDLLVGERALAANAERLGLVGRYRTATSAADLLRDAQVVLVQAPKGLDELRATAGDVARYAAPDVQLFVGARLKYLSPATADVLGESFESVRVSLARQKSRVLNCSRPRPGGPAAGPTTRFDTDLDLHVSAYPGIFAGTKLDLGTRFLLQFLEEMRPGATAAIDLGCGSGILAAALAARRPGLRVIATDQSYLAVRSAEATMAANDLADRVSVVRDDGLSSQPDATADLVVCNPPFHSGGSVQTGLADRLFADAGRVLRPGGELWTVFNSHLHYRPTLQREVGPTRQAGRNPRFTVTVSTRPES